MVTSELKLTEEQEAVAGKAAGDHEGKAKLVAQVIRQIKEDLGYGGTAPLHELLMMTPCGPLVNYLSEEGLKKLNK